MLAADLGLVGDSLQGTALLQDAGLTLRLEEEGTNGNGHVPVLRPNHFKDFLGSGVLSVTCLVGLPAALLPHSLTLGAAGAGQGSAQLFQRSITCRYLGGGSGHLRQGAEAQEKPHSDGVLSTSPRQGHMAARAAQDTQEQRAAASRDPVDHWSHYRIFKQSSGAGRVTTVLVRQD